MEEVEYIKSFYNKNATIWGHNHANPFFYELPFRKFVKLLKNGNEVADIGCAWGSNVPLFLGIGNKLKYQGFDISSSMIKLARSRYPQLSFKIMNLVEKKTLPKKQYDAFFATAVLQHIPLRGWGEMLENIKSLVKLEGFGFISIPGKKPVSIFGKVDKRQFTIFTKQEAIKLFKSNGWKVVTTGTLMGRNDIPWNWFIVKLTKK